jgi:3-oxoacyl-[acyl-carrier-protein] synthase III
MRFEHVVLARASYVLPDEVVRSEDLERALEPVYRRHRLREGRLELMTGIRERRFFPPGTRPSEVAARAGELALEGFDRARVGLAIHASVCRDFLEPATASVVHHRLGLPSACAAFDLSNACLGVVNAIALIAAQVELGAIDAGLAVAGECGRPLVEGTIRALLEAPDVSKDELKAAFASLTIGSGAAAVLVARRELAPDAPGLVAATARAATEHHVLCHGDYAVEGGMRMSTDSEALLHAGNELAQRTFRDFLDEARWTEREIERILTHQVGSAHRKLLLQSMGLGLERDYPTFETLGNVGSVSLPLSYAKAREVGFVARGQRVALLGIGSGLHCQMLAVR